MLRKELMRCLKAVKPGLSKNPMVPLLQKFWFDGKRLMTFNDVIAISVPCPMPFKAAVSGFLFKVVDEMGAAEEVLLTEEPNGTVMVRAGATKVRLETSPHEASIFTMPSPPTEDDFHEELIAGLAFCMRSVAKDADVWNGEEAGITVVPDGERNMLLFSTNKITLSRACVNQPFLGDKPFVLPGLFCKQLVLLAKKKAVVRLHVHYPYYIMAAIDDTLLFGRLTKVKNPLDFPAIYDTHIHASKATGFERIPEELPNIIHNAGVLATDLDKLSILVDKGRMFLEVHSARGGLVHSLKTTQGPVRIKIDPQKLTGIEDFDEWLVNHKCVVLRAHATNYTFIAATGGS